MEKVRLDQLLYEKNYFDSREKAKSAIMAGVVYINNQKMDKAGTKVPVDVEIFIKENPLIYVSRGGLKLEKAIKDFTIHLNDKICMDIGASTGGFTDCMLQNGASKVFSIDVGYGQLDYKLRQDPRVVSLERTNVRYVTQENIGMKVDFASIDVSFISLKLVLPVVKTLIKDDGEIVALIKPQFEAGKEKVGKKGVVRDINTHKEVVLEIIKFAKGLNFSVQGFSFSPIKGPEGNIEYLLYLSNYSSDDVTMDNIINTIEASHQQL